MRIIYFHQHFSTPKGSTGIRSYEMARNLVASGHQVIMVCGSYKGGNTGIDAQFVNGERRGVVDGIDVIEFELEYSNTQTFIQRTRAFLSFAFKSVRVVFRENYDLLFATTTPLTAAIPGIFARWLRRKPFVFEVRDLWPELPREMGVITNPIILGAMSLLEWLAYKSSTGLVALSPGIKNGIERLGIPSHKVVMIPNGCDLNIFDAKSPLWQPDGVADTDFIAIYTGTHGIANGLEILIGVASELKERGRSDIKILLVGQGKLKRQLMDMANKEELGNIIFHDPVNKEMLAGLMRRAQIGMQLLANVPAFYYGTSPNKFFDYIAAGLPVLNNYPGWLADMILENNCGAVVPPENAIEFANTLIHLADNRNLLPPMSESASKLARERFDRSKLAVEFISCLEKNRRRD